MLLAPGIDRPRVERVIDDASLLKQLLIVLMGEAETERQCMKAGGLWREVMAISIGASDYGRECTYARVVDLKSLHERVKAATLPEMRKRRTGNIEWNRAFPCGRLEYRFSRNIEN